MIIIRGKLYASGLFYLYDEETGIMSESMTMKDAEDLLSRIHDTGSASVRISYIGKIKKKQDFERLIPLKLENGEYSYEIS